MLFYTNRSMNGKESTAIAFSKNLLEWNKATYNPILTKRKGWAGATINGECVWADFKNDTLFVLMAGAKEVKDGWFHHYVTGRMYLDRKGNPHKTQIGGYFSTDFGKSWTAHSANPLWVCNYGDESQADHLGGDLFYLASDSAEYIVYQAKGKRGVNWDYKIYLSRR